jgi:predicted phosphoribosyltransferase
MYVDRRDAGRTLAEAVAAADLKGEIIVLGLPRGGVPVAYEVARELQAPLDIMPVRKLGVPGRPELAMGAVALGGARVLNPYVISSLRVKDADVSAVTAREEQELARIEERYGRGRSVLDLAGKTVVLVDDGLATGATMRAAVLASRIMHAEAVLTALPVASADALDILAKEADRVVCPDVSDDFRAVGAFYRHFDQTGDEEVLTLLEQAGTSGSD